MFRVHPKDTDKIYRLAVVGLLLLSVAALAVTVWVMVDFLREQSIVEELIQKLPNDAKSSAEALAGELRWQFRLTILVVLNVVVTGFAIVLLWRAYRSSQESLRDIKTVAGDILGSMDQAVITTDLAGHVTSINRRGLELLAPKTECVGRPLQELSTIPLHEFLTDWLVERSLTIARDIHLSKNGSTQTLRIFCQSLNDFEGNEIGNVLQVRDVSDRVLIEDRMRRMERYMGLGSLAGGLHHEIKNPLAALSLHVQLLEEQLDSGDASNEIQQMLGVIKTEVTRIGGVLEGFRDFASVGQLCFVSVNLVDVIERQVKLLTPRAKQQCIKITMQADASIDKVPVDRVRLEQVLLNLLLNAMEAMTDGGELAISMSTTQTAVEIEVTDTGCGIPENLQDKVFDPYFTTKGEGTGLGLAICDKIIRQHHGSLEFQTSPDGTTFQLTLPTTQKSDEAH